MNNKHLSWNKEINNNFIIASRAYFLQWDGVVINGEHLDVDHIYYMIHVRPSSLQCSEAMSVHARLVKFNPSIPHVKNCLAPVVCERRAYHTRSSRGVSARRTFASVHTQGEHFIPWNLVKGSSYNATAVLSKIRCIKDKHQMQSKYVTWYGHHHLVLLISISKASSWSPSSPARHLDLHHCTMVVSPTIASTTIANT